MSKYLIACWILILNFFTLQGEKYALIIAIGDYPTQSGWTDLSSSNDEKLVKETLMALGFEAHNIFSIRDEVATKVNILALFNTIQNKLKQGDIVYIHYSGHGQQVLDDNQDELDKLDEAIVPYDSPQKFQKGVYEGERLIRDDLLGELTNKMRTKCGKSGQLILILDSCHSGTGTRGLGKARGTNIIMAPENFVVPKAVNEQSMQVSTSINNNLSPMGCFFGSSARELNYETLDHENNSVGSLTYAISSTLMGMKVSYTFADFFDRVKLKMKMLAPRQNPQWEGPQHEKLFGGNTLSINEYYKIIEVKADNTLVAQFGALNDVYKGSKVEIFSKDKNKLLSRGEVTNAGMTTATIVCEEAFVKGPNELLLAKIIDKAHPSIQVSICTLLKPGKIKEWDDLVFKLKQMPLIEADSSNAELYIDEHQNALTLSTRDGLVLFKADNDLNKTNQNVEDLELKIRTYIQGKFIKSFENPQSRLTFKVEILSVDCATQAPVSTMDQMDLKLRTGSCVKFKITNEGIKGAYFSLLDIQPDHTINLVLPAVNLGYTAEEYYLKAGESFTTDYVIQISEPLGEETLKLITSKTPQDLSGILFNSGVSKKGNQAMDSFEKILSSTYGDRGKASINFKCPGAEEVGSYTTFFTIIE